MSRMKWHRLRAEAPLLLVALGTVIVIRLGLWVLPFRTLRAILARAGQRSGLQRAPAHLAWAVAVTSPFVPAASCLTQALATDVLLRRAGYQGVLHIGVTLRHGRLAAHAWVEYDGVIMIGGRGHQDFTPLPPLQIT